MSSKVHKIKMTFLTDALHYSSALRGVVVKIIYPDDVIDEHEKTLLNGYTQLRTDYVLQEGWPIDASGVDIDVYDSAAPTVYIVAYEKSTNIVLAGVRLTRVTSVIGSLSFSMWKNAYEKERFLSGYMDKTGLVLTLDDAGRNHMLWDVTRLITLTAISASYSRKYKIASRIAIVRVLGVMASVTGENAWWIYTVGEKMYKFMGRNHLSSENISSGHVSESDKEPAFFSATHANTSLQYLKSHNKSAYHLVTKSLNTHKKATKNVL